MVVGKGGFCAFTEDFMEKNRRTLRFIMKMVSQ